jgi:hypothetical protein
VQLVHHPTQSSPLPLQTLIHNPHDCDTHSFNKHSTSSYNRRPSQTWELCIIITVSDSFYLPILPFFVRNLVYCVLLLPIVNRRPLVHDLERYIVVMGCYQVRKAHCGWSSSELPLGCKHGRPEFLLYLLTRPYGSFHPPFLISKRHLRPLFFERWEGYGRYRAVARQCQR